MTQPRLDTALATIIPAELIFLLAPKSRAYLFRR